VSLHAGHHAAFTNAEFIVQRAHYAAAQTDACYDATRAQRENVARVIFGHDGQQWQALKKLPEYYE
jgi:hypothetical protein